MEDTDKATDKKRENGKAYDSHAATLLWTGIYLKRVRIEFHANKASDTLATDAGNDVINHYVIVGQFLSLPAP